MVLIVLYLRFIPRSRCESNQPKAGWKTAPRYWNLLVFSAKGAVFILAWGNAPGICGRLIQVAIWSAVGSATPHRFAKLHWSVAPATLDYKLGVPRLRALKANSARPRSISPPVSFAKAAALFPPAPPP